MEKTNQKMPAYMPMYEQDDEIDFLELWEWIWTQKLLIMGVMILAMMGAGLYLKVATPIYEAEVFLSAPLLEDLVLLNQKDVAKGTTTPDGVFQDFLNNFLLFELSLLLVILLLCLAKACFCACFIAFFEDIISYLSILFQLYQ